MAETWLRSNRRPFALGIFLSNMLLFAGFGLAAWFNARRAVACIAALELLVFVAIWWRTREPPRLAYEDRHLLINAGTGPAYRVPIELVEGFLFGQGPSMLPGMRYGRLETSTFIIRLADKAEAWQQRDIRPWLGKWCGGYVTLRGTWCEPLDVALVERLNFRLAEVSRRIASESRP